jgi:O-antigen biosynthesis protein WbqP
MKRLIDVAVAVVALLILALPLVFVTILVRATSDGPVLYWSDRVGQGNRIFRMPKFRTMRVGTPAVATHLLNNPESFLTPIGRILRRTSLDELPQLWSILVGDMSLVGPRPALFNQDDLVALRTTLGIHALKPGLTGWAQVNGRDELSTVDKVGFDQEYLNRKSLLLDIRIIVMTVRRAVTGAGVAH